MKMDVELSLKKRTKAFALNIVKFVQKLPNLRISDVLCKQLLRSGTSVGANYRAACRARSIADFIAKMGLVEEETDESIYWLELLVESGLVSKDSVASLVEEANQLLAMTVSSIRTARRKKTTVIA